MAVGITCHPQVALVNLNSKWAFGVVFRTQWHAVDFLEWLAEEPRAPVLEAFAEYAEAFAKPECYENTVLEALIERWRVERCDREGNLLRTPPAPPEVDEALLEGIRLQIGRGAGCAGWASDHSIDLPELQAAVLRVLEGVEGDDEEELVAFGVVCAMIGYNARMAQVGGAR